MTRPLTVRYVQCDPGLAQPESFLSRLVGLATEREIVVSDDQRQEVDVQFTSVQLPLWTKAKREVQRVVKRRFAPGRLDARWQTANPGPSGQARAHVWFTGENIRPPAAPWDGYLSFDLDPLRGRNAYLPLWWYSIGLLGSAHSTFTTQAPSVRDLLDPRDPGRRRPRFACAFINNPDPVRLHAVQALSSVGKVDIYGAAVGRHVVDKAEVAGQYRFVLCFENDIYPGYVTEKAIEAWGTGAVPLWSGSDPAGYLNPSAMINAAALPSLDAFAEAVAAMDSDSSAWEAAAGSPLVTREPDLTPAVELLRRLVVA